MRDATYFKVTHTPNSNRYCCFYFQGGGSGRKVKEMPTLQKNHVKFRPKIGLWRLETQNKTLLLLRCLNKLGITYDHFTADTILTEESNSSGIAPAEA